MILVDQNDIIIGTAEKMLAHQQGLCHRAFSIFIVNAIENDWEVLLQQRAASKYHSQNLWTNACCSHPNPNEDILDAGNRRLQEEFGFTLSLEHIGTFHYIAHLTEGLIENEVDHVLLGYGKPTDINPNPDEISDYRWIRLSDLQNELQAYPERFTAWLKPALEFVTTVLKQ